MPRKMSELNRSKSIELKVSNEPCPSITIIEAEMLSGVGEVYLRKVAYAGEINYGHIKDMGGMRIVKDKKWELFLEKRGFLAKAREIKPGDYQNCGRKKKNPVQE